MPISNELIDQLLQDCHSPQELLGESGLLKVLTKRLAERVLQADMEIHLGYAKHDPAGNHSGNSRNGKTSKSVRSQNGALELDIPRDRNSTFEPTLIGIAKRLNFDYTIWTENKLSVSQPISLFLLFACAHLCSIGLRSGEYVGKYSTIYPASMMTC